jgi:hypothetical protein
MRRILIPGSLLCGAAIVAVFALAMFPARARAAEQPYGVGAAGPNERYVDATGAKLRYGMQARRIVSLAPNVTEMLYFLGLGERLVGRSDYCDYPPEAAKLPSVGGFVDTSLESIVSLKPDLVVAYQGTAANWWTSSGNWASPCWPLAKRRRWMRSASRCWRCATWPMWRRAITRPGWWTGMTASNGSQRGARPPSPNQRCSSAIPAR